MAKLEVTNELLQHIARAESPATLGAIVKADWGGKVYFGAVPYLQALLEMDSFDQQYYQEYGRHIGLRFLGQAFSYRGPVAKAVKLRIKELCSK